MTHLRQYGRLVLWVGETSFRGHRSATFGGRRRLANVPKTLRFQKILEGIGNPGHLTLLFIVVLYLAKQAPIPTASSPGIRVTDSLTGPAPVAPLGNPTSRKWTGSSPNPATMSGKRLFFAVSLLRSDRPAIGVQQLVITRFVDDELPMIPQAGQTTATDLRVSVLGCSVAGWLGIAGRRQVVMTATKNIFGWFRLFALYYW